MFTRYQCRVQWAKSILQEQGFDDCSVARILENYTKPLELPLSGKDGAAQTGNNANGTDLQTESTDLPRESSAETGDVVVLSPGKQNEGYKKASSEGDHAVDPAAMRGSEEQAQGDTACQKHGFLMPCGCKAQESTEHRSCETIKPKECAPEYVLVQEEEEGSLCPEDDSAQAQENVRSVLRECSGDPHL